MAISAGDWSPTDTLLAMALRLDEQARCPGCGEYADEAHDPEMDGGYEVEEVVCQACAARARWQTEHQKSKNPEPGVLTVLRKLTKKKRKRRASGAQPRAGHDPA